MQKTPPRTHDLLEGQERLPISTVRRNVLQIYRKLGITIRYKDEGMTFLLRVVYAIMWLVPPLNADRFLKHYANVWFGEVWVPSRRWLTDRRVLHVLTHELVHIADAVDIPMFNAKYLLPQLWGALGLLSAFGFLGFINPWCYLFFAFASALIFLFPWPSAHRADFEARGYAITVLTLLWKGDRLTDYPGSVLRAMYGPEYYHMASSEEEARERLYEYVRTCNDPGRWATMVRRDLPIARVIRDAFLDPSFDVDDPSYAELFERYTEVQ